MTEEDISESLLYIGIDIHIYVHLCVGVGLAVWVYIYIELTPILLLQGPECPNDGRRHF